MQTPHLPGPAQQNCAGTPPQRVIDCSVNVVLPADSTAILQTYSPNTRLSPIRLHTKRKFAPGLAGNGCAAHHGRQFPAGLDYTRMKAARSTSRDIADAAGVSQATVSRALRGSPLVRPETRNRILEIARQLNYRVDHTAAGLRTGHSRTIALLLFEDTTTDQSHINPFFLSLLSSITRAAARLDYDVLVSFQQLSRDWVARYEASNRADGLILLGYGDYVKYAEKLQTLTQADAHFILWGPTTPATLGHSVGCDNTGGGHAATTHLIGLGRRRIAFLGGASDHYPEFQARYKGYSDALRGAGIGVDEQLQVDADNLLDSGEAAIRELLDRNRTFDAVFAASDLIAIGALRALRHASVSVPDDVSIVGFDDIPAAAYVHPTLTTVHQDTRLAGELLVSKLIKMIEGEDVASELLDTTLVVRESCGAR